MYRGAGDPPSFHMRDTRSGTESVFLLVESSNFGFRPKMRRLGSPRDLQFDHGRVLRDAVDPRRDSLACEPTLRRPPIRPHALANDLYGPS
jgi:hypothetical protein